MPDAPLQALIFDSVFNSFRGIIAYYSIFNGTIKKGDNIKIISTDEEYEADEVGTLKLGLVPKNEVESRRCWIYYNWNKKCQRS